MEGHWYLFQRQRHFSVGPLWLLGRQRMAVEWETSLEPSRTLLFCDTAMIGISVTDHVSSGCQILFNFTFILLVCGLSHT